jgi:hypothetical protein
MPLFLFLLIYYIYIHTFIHPSSIQWRPAAKVSSLPKLSLEITPWGALPGYEHGAARHTITTEPLTVCIAIKMYNVAHTDDDRGQSSAHCSPLLALEMKCKKNIKRLRKMKQISGVKEKPFASSLNICPEARDGIVKLLRSPGNDSKKSIPPAYL